MKKCFSLLLMGLTALVAMSQRAVDSMVQTEKKFANTALVGSTNEAFIKFIDSSGVVFDKGKPVNGLQLYTNSDRRPGILTWEPAYAEIASSNDFGYTTGPWKFFQNSLKDNPLATGYFVTVWHLNDVRQWKFLIDFGISCAKEKRKLGLKKKSVAAPGVKQESSNSLIGAENQFLEAYGAQGTRVYSSFLSGQSRLNYAGFLPATNAAERKALLDSLPANIKYTVLGSGTSPANDLGFVYGSADVNGKPDGYLRIWRREPGGWKIAVEVLHFK